MNDTDIDQEEDLQPGAEEQLQPSASEFVAQQRAQPSASEFVKQERQQQSATEFVKQQRAGWLEKTVKTPWRAALQFNVGLEKGVESMGRALEQTTDIGEQPQTYREYMRSALRASEFYEPESQAAGELAQQREEKRQALKMPALRQAAGEIKQEFQQMTEQTPGYNVPGAEMAGEMTPALLAGALPVVGPAAAAVVGGAQTYGQVWEQAHDYYAQQGYSEKQAAAIADNLASGAGALNAGVFMFTPGAANRVAGYALGQRLAAQPVARAIVKTGLAGVQSGAVMGLDTAIRDLQAKGTYRPDLTLGQATKEVFESGVFGTGVGALLHAPMEAAQMPPGPDALTKSFRAAREGAKTPDEVKAMTPEEIKAGEEEDKPESQAQAAFKEAGIGEKIEEQVAEAAAESRASVPLMVTREMEQRLRQAGFTQEEINAMTPADAHALLEGEAPAAAEEKPAGQPAEKAAEKPAGDKPEQTSEQIEEQLRRIGYTFAEMEDLTADQVREALATGKRVKVKGEVLPSAPEPTELTTAERLHLDNVKAAAEKIRPGIKVVYHPGKRNVGGELMDGWYDNDGQMVINAGEVGSLRQVRRIAGEEWGHNLLASPEGQAGITEFMKNYGLTRDQAADLYKRGYHPHPDETDDQYKRRLHDEFIAKHARDPLPWLHDMVDQFTGWAKGRMGLDLTQAQAARALLRRLDPRVGTDANGHRASLVESRGDEFTPAETDPDDTSNVAPTAAEDQVLGDWRRYNNLVRTMPGKSLDEAMQAAAEIERIKNRHGGMPPPQPGTPEAMASVKRMEDERDPRSGIFITTRPIKRDTLDELGSAEVKKREGSVKMIHLQQAADDVAAAFDKPIISRTPVAQKGERYGMGVGEKIQIATDDMDEAMMMAGLIGASAPQVAEGARVWKEHAGGPNTLVEIEPRGREVGMEMVDDWQKTHPKDEFDYDPQTRKISTVLGGRNDAELAQNIDEFADFVERHKANGNVAKSKTPTFREGSAHFLESGSHQQAIDATRDYASGRPAGQRQRLLDVAQRAADRLAFDRAGIRTKARAERIISTLRAPPESASAIARALDRLPHAEGERPFTSIRKFARWVDDRFTARYGKPLFEIGDPKARQRASDTVVYDVLDGLSRDGSGKGWYSDRVRATMQEAVKLHPELKDDPHAQAIFMGILSSTSQNYTVEQNFVIAERIYRKWQESRAKGGVGRIPTDNKLAKAADPINENLDKINRIIDAHGVPWFIRFMDQKVSGEYFRKEFGDQYGLNLDEYARGARILGPKIGSFFGNLRGRLDTITMDLWFTRSMHRALGAMRTPITEEGAQKQLQNFRDAFAARVKEGGKLYGLDPSKALADDDEIIESALKVFNGWSSGEKARDAEGNIIKDQDKKPVYKVKPYSKKIDTTKSGHDLERMARAVKSSLGDMQAAPAGPTERRWFEEITHEAQRKLAKVGINLTFADLQAILWYREKNLFAHAGVASDSTKPADYLDAVMALRNKVAKGELYDDPEGGGVAERESLVEPGVVEPGVDNWKQAVPRLSLVDLDEHFRRARVGFQTVFSPQNLDSQSKRFANALRDLNGEQAIGLVRSAAKMQELRDYFDRFPVPKGWKYDPSKPLPLVYQVIAGLETNRAALPPRMQEFARIIDQEFAWRIAEVQKLQPGALQQLIQDYFPHMWKSSSSSAVNNFMAEVAGRAPLAGSKAFMRQRSVPTTLEGLERGLEPISDNPVDLALAKMHQMDKFILSAKLLQEAKSTGMLKFYRLGTKIPDGKRIVDDRAGTVFAPPVVPGGAGPQLVGHWTLPDGAAQVLENHLSPGLQRFMLYRTARAASNILNGAQLGFSAFHLGFTSGDAVVSSMATALTYALRGQVGKAGKSAAVAAAAPVLNYYFGKAIQERMVDPTSRGVRILGMHSDLTPAINDMVGRVAQLAVKGGLRAESDPFWRTAVTRNLKRMFYEGGVQNYARAGMAAPFAVIEQSIRPIAEYLVPRQKLGVFGQMALQEMDRIGWGAGRDEVRQAMAQAADNTEDRMGQVTYDNLFYNRTAKDLALLGFRAYGWQLGKYRALYGAGVDTVRAAKALRQGKIEVTNRMMYPVALTLVAGALGALMHRLMTGENPQTLKDYMFPQSGQTNPDGTPSRVMLPTYLKDLISDWKDFPDIKRMGASFYHKLNPAVAGIVDMWNNKDFYGTQIADPSDPLLARAYEYGEFAAKNFAPFSLTGGMKMYEQGAPWSQLLLPFIGIVPAKQALLMSPAQTLSAELYRDTFPVGARSRSDAEHAQLLRDIVKDMRDHPGEQNQVLSQAQAAGQLRASDTARLRSMLSGKAPLVFQAGKLAPENAMRVWRLATAEERAQIFPVIAQRLSRTKSMDPALRTKMIAELLRDRPQGM